MKLPENPTKKVRDILVIQIQCPRARLTDEELYKIKELCNCLDNTISTMRLHAGDCCSLNNEVGLFRGHWEDAEERCDELQKALQDIVDCDIRHFHSSACIKMKKIANKVLKG